MPSDVRSVLTDKRNTLASKVVDERTEDLLQAGDGSETKSVVASHVSAALRDEGETGKGEDGERKGDGESEGVENGEGSTSRGALAFAKKSAHSSSDMAGACNTTSDVAQ